MRVRSKFAVLLLDAMEVVGLDRGELMSAVKLDDEKLREPRGYVQWSAFAGLLDRAWVELGQDPARMRDVGRAAAHAPTSVLLQRLARTVFSVTRLYDVATRWGARGTFTKLSLEREVVSRHRLRFVGSLPENVAACAPFFHMFTGVLLEIPALLGLPPATLVACTVGPRALDVVIDVPPSASVVGRLQRALRAAVHSNDALDLLEEQRRELTARIQEAERGAAEILDILDRLPDLVIIHHEGKLLWMNRANLKALGYERIEEVVARPLFDFIEPESRELVRARMRLPVDASVPELSEIRLVSRDGRVVVVEISPAQGVTFEGKTARLIVGRDVTDRVRLQQQLLVADRMASIGMLAAGVAHEVNNPLAYVLNNIEIAMRLLGPLGDATAQSRAVLDVALEGVDRIRTIVRDLLALTRVDDVTVGPIDALAVVESTLALASKSISERAVLTFEPHPVPLARGNVARLGQVVVNLLTNALESMPSSSRTENQLRVVVRPASGGVVIEVSDNGVGIAPEHASHIFEPFFTTKARSGTGLGLAICQRLVTEMGGWLTFESTPLHGSTFRVTLPASPQSEVPAVRAQGFEPR